MGNSGNSVRLYFWGASKPLQIVTAVMKLKYVPVPPPPFSKWIQHCKSREKVLLPSRNPNRPKTVRPTATNPMQSFERGWNGILKDILVTN